VGGRHTSCIVEHSVIVWCR